MEQGNHVPWDWLRWMGDPGNIPMPAEGRLHLWSYVNHWMVHCQPCFERIPWARQQRRGRRRARYRRRRPVLRSWRRGRLGRVVGQVRGWRQEGRLRRVGQQQQDLHNQLMLERRWDEPLDNEMGED